MDPASDVKVQCPRCHRRASPQLRAVARGLLSVCPYCLSPHPLRPRAHGAQRNAPDNAAPADARIR
jgi:hypothetical protein